ncbi:MAG: NADH-quinone oxidoreductase subunit NuoF [bacterium]
MGKNSNSSDSSQNIKVIVCGGTGCVSAGSLDIYDELNEQISDLDKDIEIKLEDDSCNAGEIETKTSGCHGFCDRGPLIRIDPAGILYTKVSEDDVDNIVQKTLKNGEIIDSLCYEGPDGETRRLESDIPFYNRQERLVLKNCGTIDPESIQDYKDSGGYRALKKVLDEMTPEEVRQEILDSNLRGRGGAGFPTGLKWNFTADQEGEQKYVIANCDEGDPGAFMDRSLMEGDPHRVIEGMIIGAYAVKATKGYIFIRIEYPLAIERLEKNLTALREEGYLGENILGSDFDFDIEMRLGAGAFVCGEETALIEAIEGERGMPRPRPPYPSIEGLWEKPTLINNVETLANVPDIIKNGGEWFTEMGTEDSPGTKIFALAGDVVNTGLVEVPMGISLREVVEEIGGGIRGGKDVKAVQTGGPAGGCIPADKMDIPIDFENLEEAGSMMGSGGMIVMDDETCMVSLARFFMEFSKDESCGKCTPCREGTTRLLEILDNITRGRGQENDIYRLKRLARVAREASLCGLGQAAPNPVISTLDYFEEEYKEHIEEQECHAGDCIHLVTYEIDPENCVGCGACRLNCPVECISGSSQEVHVIDQDVCIKCGNCYEVCNFDAVMK